jgi:hypothetical protein
MSWFKGRTSEPDTNDAASEAHEENESRR